MKDNIKTGVKFLALFLCAVSIMFVLAEVRVSAEEVLPRVVDWADLLSDSEEARLMEKLDEISERQQLDVVVVTVESLEGATAESYADDFFDYNGYGYGDEYDGVLLLVSIGEREWHISTCGYGITAFTDYGLERMEDMFLPYLSDDDYVRAFEVFAELCDDYITKAKAGEPYDVYNAPKEPFPLVTTLFIAFIIAFIISVIVTAIMKSGLNSVKSQDAADSYVKRDSLCITQAGDLFLYKNVERHRRQSSSSHGGSSTHRSSSGRSHGGRGGRF